MRCIQSEQRSDLYKVFTLIELLVVISIIVLLISILLPALAKARDVSRAVVCSTKLHGMGLANQMYAQDYKGYFVQGNHESGDFGHWQPKLLVYLNYKRPATSNAIKALSLQHVHTMLATAKCDWPSSPTTSGFFGESTFSTEQV